MKDNTPLQVTQNLLMLERGSDELLLADALHLKPLYIRSGQKYIKQFLESLHFQTYREMINLFPGDIDLLHMLLEYRIISPVGYSSDASLTSCEEKPGFENKKNISLYLLISQACNMNCIYCLNGKKTYQRDKSLMMNKDVAFQSVERCLNSLSPDGFLEIIFFGGEPLLNWPLIKETIRYCENILKPAHEGKTVRYHLTTNLSLIPKDLIVWAKKYDITFLCDVDGPRHIHDQCRPFKDGSPSYAKIVKNIRRLTEVGVPVMLRTTVTALNHDHLVETSQLHKDLGGHSCAFVPVNPFNSDEDILDDGLLPSVSKLARAMAEIYGSKLWEEARLYPFNTYAPRLMSGNPTFQGCGFPYGNTPVVDINGDVYPCIYLVGIVKFHLGNVMNGSYPKRKVLKWIYEYLHIDNNEHCISCNWRYICSGSCPIGRLIVLENPSSGERIRKYCEQIRCEYTKHIFELILWNKAEQAASGLSIHNRTKSSGIPEALHCF